MAFQFVGDNAKQNVHSIMSNWESEENMISYKMPSDHKPISTKLFSSSKDWLYQVRAGPAIA